MLGQAPGGSLSNTKSLLKSSPAARGRLRSCQAQNPMQVEAWRSNIVSSPEEAIKIAREARLVGVLGIAPESKASGVRIIPIPVYYPEATNILGEKVYRKVADVPQAPLDILDVFRRPEDLAQHLDDILAAKPKVVWLQSGISQPAFEEAVARAGIRIIADRCLKVDRARALSHL